MLERIKLFIYLFSRKNIFLIETGNALPLALEGGFYDFTCDLKTKKGFCLEISFLRKTCDYNDWDEEEKQIKAWTT